jgi:hypothetical protein
MRCAFARDCKDPEDCGFCEDRAEFMAEDAHSYSPDAELAAADAQARWDR